MNVLIVESLRDGAYCIVPGDHPARPHIKAEDTNIRRTFARFAHPNPAHDDYDAADAQAWLGEYGAAKP